MAAAEDSGMISISAWAAARAFRTATQRAVRAFSPKTARDSGVDQAWP